MANRKAVLVKLVKTENGWRRYPAVIGRNGRIKPDFVLVNGKEQELSGGRYQIRTYIGSKMVYTDAGEHAGDALAAKNQTALKLAAQESATAAGLRIADTPGRSKLTAKARDFIRDAEQRGALVAADVNRLVTDEFVMCVKKTFVDEISREDIFSFHRSLRRRGCADRTISNKHARLTSFLRFAGVDTKIIPPDPGYDKTLPTMYTREQVASIIDAADPYMKLAIQLALKCGLREQEIVHVEWSDIHQHDKVLRVSSKPLYKFKVKDAEERDIPIPDDLLTALTMWHDNDSEAGLLLGTKRGYPNRKLLRTLKRLAKRAELNCNRCEGCKSKLGECQQWTLHKFRRTYCTTLLRSGLDLRTVQAYMGHADLSSTMRYLRPASTAESQSRINAIQW